MPYQLLRACCFKGFEREKLNVSDKFSFDQPPIESQEDWTNLLDNTWADAENFSNLIGQLPEDMLREDFFDGKYGNYYQNLHGITEHAHYHLGQIVLIKKLLLQPDKSI